MGNPETLIEKPTQLSGFTSVVDILSRTQTVFSQAKMVIAFCLLFCLSHPTLRSQTPAIDSLKRSLADPTKDRLVTLFELCWRGESMPTDTLMMFANMAKQLSSRNHDYAGRLQSEFFIARCYNLNGRSDSALIICDRNLQEIKDPDQMFTIYSRFLWYKIVSLTKLRKIKESIAECFKLLQMAEKNNDVYARVVATNNLGVNNNILGNRQEAVDWFNKAYALIKDDSLYKSFPLVFTNLSALYFSKNKTDSGYYFLRRAMYIAKINQNLRNEADCYTLQGLVYTQFGKLDSAEQQLKQAVAIQKQIGNIQFILVGIDAMQTFYARQKNYAKAVEYIKLAEDYSRKYHEPITSSFYQDLASYYKEMKDYRNYGETMDTLLKLKDSMYLKSKAVDLAELEARYEVSSKEAFIARQKLELLHKNIWIGIAVFFLLLIGAGAIILFRRNRRKQLLELTAAEEKERRRIAADLHDNIGAYASAISAGVDEIQARKLMPDHAAIDALKSNATEIMTSLRDTIWAFNKDSITLTGISDRVKMYVQKIRLMYPSVSFQIEENILVDLRLSPVRALHVFRILQEAINNAVKHSQGSRVDINISSDAASTEFWVEDNGTGFNPVQVNKTGNGLTNMRHRSAEAGFNLLFSEVHPSGTRITVVSMAK